MGLAVQMAGSDLHVQAVEFTGPGIWGTTCLSQPLGGGGGGGSTVVDTELSYVSVVLTLYLICASHVPLSCQSHCE